MGKLNQREFPEIILYNLEYSSRIDWEMSKYVEEQALCVQFCFELRLQTVNLDKWRSVILTLLWYHEKSYVNSTIKNHNINTVYYNVLFPQIIFHNTGLYSNIDK